MTLNVWTPYSGIHAGNPFALPPIKDAHQPISHYNRQGTAQIEFEEMDGAHLTSGTNTTFLAYGEITVTFFWTPLWLTTNGYTGNFGGMETANIDFMMWVVQGGLGVLRDDLPSPTLLGKSGVSVTSRSCTAAVHGDTKPIRKTGSAVLEFECTFIVPSGYWTYNDAARTLVPIG